VHETIKRIASDLADHHAVDLEQQLHFLNRNSSAWCAKESARLRHSRWLPWCRGCPKPAPAKSCAGPSSASPMGRNTAIPATIDDPLALEEISAALAGLGYPRRGN
jgi:hypothetical protein